MKRIVCMALLAACATPMSVAEHEEAARREDEAAAEQEARFDPSLALYLNSCFGGINLNAPCWAGESNPTDGYLREAARLRAKAARHRAQSQALRDAEARACAGLTPSERDISPLMHRELVAAARPLETEPDEGHPPRDRGVRVWLREVKGLTAERLQLHLDCHLARNAALGAGYAEKQDPLDLPGTAAYVRKDGDKLTILLVNDRQKEAREIAARALALVTPAP